MSSDTSIESEGDGNGNESIDDELPALKARVRDLEADVYGYSNGERSAGREAMVDVKRSIIFLDNRRGGEDAVPIEDIWPITDALGLPQDVAEQAFEKLRRQGEVYEPASGEVRTT